jgi:hypothetical protein
VGQQSWRDTVAEATALDVENLLGTGIEAARGQLEEHGWFLPFALVVEIDGDVRMLAVAPESAPTDSGEPATEFDADGMLKDLAQLVRQNRGDFRAAALVCDITLVGEEQDGIHVAAEHSDGSVFAAVLPYSPDRQGGWNYGELSADDSEPVIWAD